MEVEEIEEERSYSKWEWFFYMIFIPALFATLLGGVLLSFLGVNVLGTIQQWAHKVPIIEKIVPEPPQEAKSATSTKEAADKQLESVQMDLAKNKKAADEAKAEVAQKDATIQAMDKQIKDLQKMLEDKMTTEEERQKQFQSLAKVYTTMSAKNAASIIENLSKEEAVTVLTKMKPEDQANILAKMDPKKAADISIMVKDTVVNKDSDIAALQQRLQVLTKALSDTQTNLSSVENLTNTFAQMPPQDSAKILATMMRTNQKRALAILNGMSSDKKAAVLAAVSKLDAQMAARMTGELLR